MKKKIKDKNGDVFGIEITGKDAEKLNKALEEESKNHDNFPCEKCATSGEECATSGELCINRFHEKQKNGKWKCHVCGNEVEELDRVILKGCGWFNRLEGYKEAENKIFGKIEL